VLCPSLRFRPSHHGPSNEPVSFKTRSGEGGGRNGGYRFALCSMSLEVLVHRCPFPPLAVRVFFSLHPDTSPPSSRTPNSAGLKRTRSNLPLSRSDYSKLLAQASKPVRMAAGASGGQLTLLKLPGLAPSVDRGYRPSTLASSQPTLLPCISSSCVARLYIGWRGWASAGGRG